MVRIFIREFNTYLNSLIAYIVIGIFLVVMGLLTWVFPETNVLDYGYADLGPLFNFGPYVMMFLIPAITMKMFAEENKSGTFEILATQPISDWSIISGKYLASLLLVIFAIAPTFLYYLSISMLGNPPGNIDTPGVIGSYAGFILLGAAFTAVGIWASSLTVNQVVAFVLAVFFCFILFEGISSLAGLLPDSQASITIDSLGMAGHYNSISRGLIDLRDVIYFLGLIFLMLQATKLVLASRKW